MSHLPVDGSDHHGDSSLPSSIYSDSPANTSSFASPDYIDGEPSTPRDRRMPSLSSLPERARPVLERRSLSYTPPHRTSSPYRILRTRRSTASHSHLSTAHQWSLFGQLMENEVQLQREDAGPRRRSMEQFLQPISVVQSPTEEFPSDVPIAPSIPPHPRAASAQDVYSHSEPERTVAEEVSVEGSEDTATPTTRVSRTPSTRWRVPTIPLLWKNILKCSVAYFIGSLFTFHPSLSRFFGDLTSYGNGAGGPYASAHMIATM